MHAFTTKNISNALNLKLYELSRIVEFSRKNFPVSLVKTFINLRVLTSIRFYLKAQNRG